MGDEARVTIDFELARVQQGPSPTRRTAQRRARPSVLVLRCTACDDKGRLRDPRLATRAAAIHADTAHAGARARVRSVTGPDA